MFGVEKGRGNLDAMPILPNKLKRGEMKLLVTLAHPNQQSFNQAIAQTTVETLQQNGHEIVFHDLYAEKFDPLLPDEEIPTEIVLPPELEQYCQELVSAEGIIIVHPNWWGQPPAILKGWIDRISFRLNPY